MATVLFVVPRFHTNLFFATKILVEAGHRVELLVTSAYDGEDYRFVTPRQVSAETPPEAVRSIVDEIAPDLVFLRPSSDGLAKMVGKHCRTRRFNSVVYTQEPVTRWPKLKKQWRRWKSGLPLRRVTPVPGEYPTKAKAPLATYIPWPVERAESAPARGKSSVLRVLCVAKLAQKRKNVMTLLDAAQPFVTAGKMTLTLAGSTTLDVSGGSETQIEQIGERAAASNGAIRLLKDVPFDQMPSLYATHDVCVLPSFNEPLGTAPLEAMAYGCVAVISDQCGTVGCLTDGTNGRIFDPASQAALTAILSEFASDPDLVSRLSEGARECAENDLGATLYLQRVDALLRE